MASRQIKDLVPAMQGLAMVFSTRMAEAGIPFMFTCTMRSQAEQDALYEQGRTKPGPVVTWTHHSNHIPRAEDIGTQSEGKARAFDIAILRDGKPVWDLKVDVNHDRIGDYDEAGKIGEGCGLRWGGEFHTPDRPHFELID